MSNTSVQQAYETLFKKFTFRGVVGMTVVLSAVCFLYLMAFKEIPALNEKVVFMGGGVLLAKMGTVVDWFFGSSKSESDTAKVEHAKQLTSKENTTTNTQTPADEPRPE